MIPASSLKCWQCNSPVGNDGGGSIPPCLQNNFNVTLGNGFTVENCLGNGAACAKMKMSKSQTRTVIAISITI